MRSDRQSMAALWRAQRRRRRSKRSIHWRWRGSCFFFTPRPGRFALRLGLRLGRWWRLRWAELRHHRAQLVNLLHHSEAVLQFLHPLAQAEVLRIAPRARRAPRAAIRQGREHGLQSPILPLVVALAGDLQQGGALGRRDPARADLEDDLRPSARQVVGFPLHEDPLSNRRRVVQRLLDFRQPAAEARPRGTTVHQLAQTRVEDRRVVDLEMVLQCLEHAVHGPVLPVLEGHVVDLQLAADLHLAEFLGPGRQHGLGFLLGAEDPRRAAGPLRPGTGFVPFGFGCRVLIRGIRRSFHFGCHIRVHGWC